MIFFRSFISEPFVRAATLLILSGCALASPARAATNPQDASLLDYSVHIDRTPKQAWPGYGVYLGNGYVITAAHVTAPFAGARPKVVVGTVEYPAKLVREGSFEGVDLTLMSIDTANLPSRIRMRRLPLCAKGPAPGENVIVATPEGTARSRVLPPSALPADVRGRFGTTIGDVATTGNSGSGVFDASQQCLLGIVSRKISVRTVRAGVPGPLVDLAKYFVPVADIKAFLPADVRF
jgi:hypothetical protein